VCKNWEWCWTQFAKEEYQNWLSMDLATAVAIEITFAHNYVIDNCSPLEFIHMKTPLQGWELPIDSWQQVLPFSLNTKGNLIVGNIQQSKLFHYVEKDFIDNNILLRLEELARGKKN
jgi:hypothetical protein